MIYYRFANSNDLSNIAQLHAQSWQQNYRGSFLDEYLDGPVVKDRLQVWTDRFKIPNPKQYTILAEKAEQLCGFVCLFLDTDPEYGTYIDNLHVRPDFQGAGIGKTLMLKAIEVIQQHSTSKQYFLYVLSDNDSAIAFYQKIGGQLNGTKMFDNPGGGQSEAYRIIWK